MTDWLPTFIAQCSLTPTVEDYFMGRGGKESTLESEGVTTGASVKQEVPNETFRFQYGKYGEKLKGMLVCPAWSPSGQMIGFEARSTTKKFIRDFRLPEAKWQPFWLGLRAGMPKIWAGGDVWVVEGLFDKAALEWAVPEKDAVLASVRAALSKAHIDFLQRFCKGCVHMVYDQDPTGRKATVGWVDETGRRRMGALDLLRKAGVECRDVPYSSAKDPGEFWNRGGAVAVQTAFKGALR